MKIAEAAKTMTTQSFTVAYFKFVVSRHFCLHFFLSKYLSSEHRNKRGMHLGLLQYITNGRTTYSSSRLWTQ